MNRVRDPQVETLDFFFPRRSHRGHRQKMSSSCTSVQTFSPTFRIAVHYTKYVADSTIGADRPWTTTLSPCHLSPESIHPSLIGKISQTPLGRYASCRRRSLHRQFDMDHRVVCRTRRKLACEAICLSSSSCSQPLGYSSIEPCLPIYWGTKGVVGSSEQSV